MSRSARIAARNGKTHPPERIKFRGHAAHLSGARITAAEKSLLFWKRRLLHRKYGEPARPDACKEFSVRIEHEGTSFFFPLGTTDETQAAARALEIYRTVISKGWKAACQLFAREFTLAIFWDNNPVACTYTTWFTEVHSSRNGPVEVTPGTEGLRLAIIEPNDEVRHALELWSRGQPGCSLASGFRNTKEAARRFSSQNTDLILYNRNLPDLAGGKLPASLRKRTGPRPAFAFGIYEQSDDIFISLTGVSGGYFLRRRAPREMLEPVLAAWSNGLPSLEQVNHHIRRYFQSLLAHSTETKDPAAKVNLTRREHEILDRLSKGYIDKEIADALKISAWTVHNHLKNIFKKLDVHTRTEAAIRYLEK